MKIEESEIEKVLSGYRPYPSVIWRTDTRNMLLQSCVTETATDRNSITNLFKFNLNFIMEGKKKIAVIVATIVILLSATAGTALASDSAAPGDLLYPVDLAVEQVSRSLISDPIRESEFEIGIMDERIQEMEQLENEGNFEGVANAAGEIEAQQERLRERIKAMDQLRLQEKVQTQEQLKVMEKLQAKLNQYEKAMQEVQTKLQKNGNEDAAQEIQKIRNSNGGSLQDTINEFEESAGVKLNESEQNQGEDTQIQNTNEVQNQGESSGSGQGNGNGN